MAESPAVFAGSGDLYPYSYIDLNQEAPFAMTNWGLRIELCTLYLEDQYVYAAAINCPDPWKGSGFMCLYLKQITGDHWARVRCDTWGVMGNRGASSALFFKQRTEKPKPSDELIPDSSQEDFMFLLPIDSFVECTGLYNLVHPTNELQPALWLSKDSNFDGRSFELVSNAGRLSLLLSFSLRYQEGSFVIMLGSDPDQDVVFDAKSYSGNMKEHIVDLTRHYQPRPLGDSVFLGNLQLKVCIERRILSRTLRFVVSFESTGNERSRGAEAVYASIGPRFYKKGNSSYSKDRLYLDIDPQKLHPP